MLPFVCTFSMLAQILQSQLTEGRIILPHWNSLSVGTRHALNSSQDLCKDSSDSAQKPISAAGMGDKLFENTKASQ